MIEVSLPSETRALPLWGTGELAERPQAKVLITANGAAAQAAAEYFPSYVCLAWSPVLDCRLLKGRVVHLWPDGGEAAYRDMRNFAEELRPYAEWITLHSQKGQPPGWNLSHASQAGWTKEQVMAHLRRDGCVNALAIAITEPARAAGAKPATESARYDAWMPLVKKYITHEPTYDTGGVRTWTPRRQPLEFLQVDKLLLEAIHKAPGQWNRADQMRMSAVLKSMNYVKTRTRNPHGARISAYRLSYLVGPETFGEES